MRNEFQYILSCGISTQRKISDLKTQYFNYISSGKIPSEQTENTKKKKSDGGAGIIVLKLLCLYHGITQVSDSLTPRVTENKVSHCGRKEIQIQDLRGSVNTILS